MKMGQSGNKNLINKTNASSDLKDDRGIRI